MNARIESLAYGPHGIARVGGKVYFVRNAAPGDEVELEVREDHHTYAFAEMTRLVRAGEVRRQAPCEYLPLCGGCPWQHVAPAAQLAAKERSLAELLRRVGRVESPQVLPILSTPAELGYRRRLSLRVEGRRVGYFAAASHDLVAVDHCLLAAPELAGALPLVQAWIEPTSTRINRVEVAATGEADRLVFAAQAEGPFVAADHAAAAQFLAANPRLRGIAMRGRGWRQVWGDDRVDAPLGAGESIALRAGSFVQVNTAANELLVSTVLDFAGAGGEDRVLDLYAGFGNLTFPLARSAAAVTAVERDVDSTQAGERHAEKHGYRGVTFVTADVPALLGAWAREGRSADVAVLDPPRGGAAEAVKRLLEIGPRRIVYVSCNPSTLARDLQLLSPRYRVGRVQPIDFFPQTYHVEAVAEVLLTDR